MRLTIALLLTITLVAVAPTSIFAITPGETASLPKGLWPRGRLGGLSNEGQPPPNRPAGAEIFLEGGFVYIPPPAPPETTDPRFYAQTFSITPQTETSPTPVTPTASPTPTTTRTPAPAATTTAAATAEATAPQPQPVVIIFATPAPAAGPAQFFDGGFIYVPPRPQSPDDPAFHRGTFTYSAETGRMERVPESSMVIPLAKGAATAPIPTAPPVPVPIQATGPTEPQPLAHDWSYEPAMPDSPLPPNSSDRVAGLSPTYYERTPLPAEGKAMYYNPGVMQEVLAYRLTMGQVEPCPDCVGYAALLRAGDLNRRVWIKWPNGVVEGPFLVIDVAAPQHIDSLLGRNWVIDVDYSTAMRHGMDRPVIVTVYDYPPLVQPYATNRTPSGPQ